MQIRSARNPIAAAMLGVLVALSVAGCWDSHKAATAMKDFSDSLGAVQTGIEAAHTDGFLDDASYKQVQTDLGQIAQGGSDVTTALQSGQKTTAAQKIQIVLNLIDQLNTDGVAHIKNADRQTAVSALVLALRGLVVQVEVFTT